ncbi:hypothetical protein [Microvirga antarctica]|uniref:hypothetical protein n=1 Tax=Microvirga antarctica TaxID=2819233 RepID=UPI001B3022CC|nr:hypothetical protein [Microvirga antarctica]
MRHLLASVSLVLVSLGVSAACAQDFDVKGLMATAMSAGRVGLAQKTKPVDAKPADLGEVVVTIIRSEGVETKSKPAEAGDMVVRNRCPESGNEQYLVKAAAFPKRYSAAQSEGDAQGWRSFKPLGTPMRFVILGPSEGPYTFKAPWGEAMVAKPGDAIVQDPANETDTYRIAATSFVCTYEVTEKPKAGG